MTQDKNKSLDQFLKQYEPATPNAPLGEANRIQFKMAAESAALEKRFSWKWIWVPAMACSLAGVIWFQNMKRETVPSTEAVEIIVNHIGSDTYSTEEVNSTGNEYIQLAEWVSN